MTQCVPGESLVPVQCLTLPAGHPHSDNLVLPTVALFSLVGFTQMTIWAKGKHRSYLKEFRDYPPLRMPIIPFLL